MKMRKLYLFKVEDRLFKENPKGLKERSRCNNSTTQAFVTKNAMGRRCAFTCTRDRHSQVMSDLTESLDSNDVLMMAQTPALPAI